VRTEMKARMRQLLAIGMCFGFVVADQQLAQAAPPVSLEDQVRHELLQLPYYGVFDYLQFAVDGTTVTLSGQARSYVLRRDALSSIKHLAGVTTVKDEIEVLPLSPFDDRIRVRLFESLYRDSALNRYRLIRVQPPISIIVSGGNITLKGIVDSEMDKNVIYDRAREVREAFSVTNELKIQ
jgi:hyperosmotically inducible protein